jgi:hypothetical protein
MSKEDARIIACGLLHDGLDADKLSDKARQEIRAAIIRLLDLASSIRTPTANEPRSAN